MSLFSAQASAEVAIVLIFAYLLQASVDFKNKPGVSEFTPQMKTTISAASHNHYAHILYVIVV